MARRSYRSYLLLAVCLLTLLSLPLGAVDGLRSTALASLRPFGSILSTFSGWVSKPYHALFPRKVADAKGELCDAYQEALRLQAENLQLRNELATLQTLNQYLGAWDNGHNGLLAARVVFRDPNLWTSALWINVGQRDNADPENPVVAVHSPVVLGHSLVGVIDQVGEKQSRVRLISGSSVSPSVRVYRDTEVSHPYLAKGEISGSSEALWRAPGSLLKGIGFNYDRSDQYGPARDLRTGRNLDYQRPEELSLVGPGDLLVTTGMDGIFPANLHVAQVVKVSPLREGSYSYDLEAKPAAGDLLSLSLVFVLPPTHPLSE